MDEYDRLTEQIKTTSRVCMIIVLSIFSGIVFFFLALKFSTFGKEPLNTNFEPIMAAPLLIGILLSSIVPQIITTARRKEYVRSLANGQKVNPIKLVQFFPTQLIIRAALLEFPAFAGILLLQPEKNLFALMSIGALALGILVLVPTEQKVENWLSKQMELIQNDVQDGE